MSLRRLCVLTALALWLVPAMGLASWTDRLENRLAEIDDAFAGDLGVYVKDLDSGESLALRGDQYWYLASAVKVAVGIAVLEAVDQGALSLDDEITLTADDYVDGAGETNWISPGEDLSIRFLFEQMLTQSDNTATDMLIREIGAESVNDMIQRHTSGETGEITTLADVRRYAYGQFHPRARELGTEGFFAVKKAGADGESARLDALADTLGVKVEDFRAQSLDEAFNAYYDSRMNAARLGSYMELFEGLANNEILEPDSRAYLISTLHAVETGDNRLKAGLPRHVRFFHKTGTQHRRACNMGVATTDTEGQARRVVIAACARGVDDLELSEAAFRSVGQAVADSGVLDRPER